MIDFYFILNFIKENKVLFITILVIAFIIYQFGDTILYLYESELGKKEFFYDYHNNRK